MTIYFKGKFNENLLNNKIKEREINNKKKRSKIYLTMQIGYKLAYKQNSCGTFKFYFIYTNKIEVSFQFIYMG